MTTEKPRIQTPTYGPTQTPADRAEYLALDAVNRFATEKPSTIGIGSPPLSAFGRQGSSAQIAITQTAMALYLATETETLAGLSTATLGSGIGAYQSLAMVEGGLPTTWADGPSSNTPAWSYASGQFQTGSTAHPVIAMATITCTAVVNVADVTLAFELFDNDTATVISRTGEFRLKNTASPVGISETIAVDTRNGPPWKWWRLLPNKPHTFRIVRTDNGPDADVTLNQLTIVVASFGMALP